jgi:hypothetical protein
VKERVRHTVSKNSSQLQHKASDVVSKVREVTPEQVQSGLGSAAESVRQRPVPFGVALAFCFGVVAGALFKRTWKLVAREEDAPKATDRQRTWLEVLPAAAVHGAVFGFVKAAVDRAGATGFQRATGARPA